MNELDLFAAVIAITEPRERAALLERKCAGRPDLRDRIDQLVGAHFKSNALLDVPATNQTTPHASNGSETASLPIAAEVAGAVIAGRSKLLQQIGEGGMGSVWNADQTEPVGRRVAVKLIRVERGQSRTICRGSRPSGRRSRSWITRILPSFSNVVAPLKRVEEDAVGVRTYRSSTTPVVVAPLKRVQCGHRRFAGLHRRHRSGPSEAPANALTSCSLVRSSTDSIVAAPLKHDRCPFPAMGFGLAM